MVKYNSSFKLYYVEKDGEPIPKTVFKFESEALNFMREAMVEHAKQMHWEEIEQQRADDEFDEMERERGY